VVHLPGVPDWRESVEISMTVRLESTVPGGLLPDVEIFTIPDDYPMMEDETGRLMDHGIYFWYVDANRNPSSYALGPFDTSDEAFDEACVGSGREP
jgi:hypothetical protein